MRTRRHIANVPLNRKTVHEQTAEKGLGEALGIQNTSELNHRHHHNERRSVLSERETEREGRRERGVRKKNNKR